MSIVEAERTLAFSEGPQRIRLRGVDWSSYRKMAEALTGRHVRLTYDRGTLELMTISPAHGNFSRLLARFVVVLSEEFDLPLKSFGDMTCDREELERGIEPDECFYIVNEPLVRGKQAIDLSVDPPPDLGIEVDVTRNSSGRLPICAALEVPEVWRWDGAAVTIHVLAADGSYRTSTASLVFPGVPADKIAEFLIQANQVEENALVKSFRKWVRKQRKS